MSKRSKLSPSRKAQIDASVVTWKKNNPEKVATYAAKYHAGLRRLCLELLGLECACCGEKEYAFLCIDHKNGGGNEHRRQLGYKKGTGGAKFFKWLLSSPEDWSSFQTLCWNCNSAKHFQGVCPHQVTNAS